MNSTRLGALCLLLAAGQAGAQPEPPGADAAGPQAAAPFREIIAPLANDRPLGYFIAGADAAAIAGTDAELCTWALEDWVRHAEGRLEIAPAAETDAVIRIYLVSPGFSRYGEMRPILVGDRRGAEVYVRTETVPPGDGGGGDGDAGDGGNGGDGSGANAAGLEPLLRDTIVYLTCLHEIGHALGMFHTDVFEDVMYYFGYGGDVAAFFGRYRSRLDSRADIARVSGLSPGDIAQLLAAYPED